MREAKVINFFVFSLLTLPVTIFAQTQSPCAGTVSITDTSKADPAVILVIANSPQASYTITGPSIYTGSGWNFIHQNIPPGTYTITWGPVVGCGTPSPEIKTTDARGSIDFAGNYKDLSAPKEYGWIDVGTNLNQLTTITVSGPATKTVQGTSFSWGSAPAGTYTVTYGEIEGQITPLPQTDTLKPGGRLNFYGTYKVEPGQFINIQSSPPSARAYINDKFVGTTPVKVKLKEGEVIKIRCSLDGYYDYFYNEFNLGRPIAPLGPESSRAESSHPCVLKNKTASPKVGKIVVKWQPPLEIDLRITGPQDQYVPRVTSFTWNDAPAGTYTVTLGNSPKGGFSTPPPQTKTLKEGETLIFEGRYLTEKELSGQRSSDKDTPPEPFQKPQGIFKKIQNTISSFFSKVFSIFGRRPSPPVIVQTSENDLQGLWKIEKVYTADSAGEFKEVSRQPQEKERYTEFKDNQLCLEGNFDVDGAPIPCTSYSPLTVSGSKLSFSQPNGVVVNGTWVVTNEKLELNLTIAQGSQTVKFRVVSTKLDKPFSTKPAPKAIPVQPIPAEQPIR